ncbi:hypothetical protein [Desulfovibrio sp. JC010]|uniref:hypothetical protein n=1 Tax=Desulfovibrio sp. JC010 TaxID=2593641 RepID=UPI0013D22A15|nr:hypothetical protein [Desulfovibrio sp. JC010]NDV28065.1 hypothetical protein [Desulfovibrio sp. JC010]
MKVNRFLLIVCVVLAAGIVSVERGFSASQPDDAFSVRKNIYVYLDCSGSIIQRGGKAKGQSPHSLLIQMIEKALNPAAGFVQPDDRVFIKFFSDKLESGGSNSIDGRDTVALDKRLEQYDNHEISFASNLDAVMADISKVVSSTENEQVYNFFIIASDFVNDPVPSRSYCTAIRAESLKANIENLADESSAVFSGDDPRNKIVMFVFPPPESSKHAQCYMQHAINMDLMVGRLNALRINYGNDDPSGVLLDNLLDSSTRWLEIEDCEFVVNSKAHYPDMLLTVKNAGIVGVRLKDILVSRDKSAIPLPEETAPWRIKSVNVQPNGSRKVSFIHNPDMKNDYRDLRTIMLSTYQEPEPLKGAPHMFSVDIPSGNIRILNVSASLIPGKDALVRLKGFVESRTEEGGAVIFSAYARENAKILMEHDDKKVQQDEELRRWIHIDVPRNKINDLDELSLQVRMGTLSAEKTVDITTWEYFRVWILCVLLPVLLGTAYIAYYIIRLRRLEALGWSSVLAFVIYVANLSLAMSWLMGMIAFKPLWAILPGAIFTALWVYQLISLVLYPYMDNFLKSTNRIPFEAYAVKLYGVAFAVASVVGVAAYFTLNIFAG